MAETSASMGEPKSHLFSGRGKHAGRTIFGSRELPTSRIRNTEGWRWKHNLFLL